MRGTRHERSHCSRTQAAVATRTERQLAASRLNRRATRGSKSGNKARDPRLIAATLGAALLFSCLPTRSFARLIEASILVPVVVTDRFGKRSSRDVSVLLVHDDASPTPRPLLVLLHGRATDAAGRAALDRARYAANARWFAALGFIVAIPARIGYGETGGDDVEDTGACQRQVYEPAADAIARQAEAVLSRLRLRADVADDRAVVVGLSFGSIGAMALAARTTQGVQAVINFAGGGGGNGKTRPGDPCDAQVLKRVFGKYGETARLPTLWIYAENDRFFGTKYPRQWFDAYVGSGGVGEFEVMPPHGEDGHPLFVEAPDSWRARVLDFLRSSGFGNAGDFPGR